MSALKGDARLPRYQRLAETLRDEVVTRRWRPGEQIPSENVIAAQYGVAPGTARQALARLVDEGLLERQHGRGTFVRRPSFDQSLFRFFRFSNEAGERVVPESRIVQRELMRAPSEVARQLQLPGEAEVIFMNRLRLIDGVPMLAEQIWLPAERFAAFMAMDASEIGPLLYPVYDSLCGEVVARAEESLTVEMATPAYARVLRLEEHTPLIVIDRLAYGYDGRPIEWRRSRGPAAQFKYHTEIR
ncbi:GntR family transcriptional regulator [Nitrogeniibacter mangrovi]|uniref:GntR family transcriptional regulator n=1 Tax=Nitrogeniibacter mangrovi TaxID=2016596 RepID=UPI0015714346|nr:GntR family transcriptional regulator [Nitrogeniibacter mangrovi]